MAAARSDLLKGLLQDVSRSFYLSLRILPSSVRPQIGLAYLLARTSDTIADTEIIPAQERLEALERLRLAIAQETAAIPNYSGFSQHQNLTAERVILDRVDESLDLLRSMAPEDRKLTQEALRIIISGQSLDLERFQCRQGGEIVALENDSELEDYTYRVAGCVGEFWTKICARHLAPQIVLSEFLPKGIAFGKGLQLVNILRDLPRDLLSGRCYIPKNRLAERRLGPSALLDIANEAAFRPLYDEYLDKAENHLATGWEYTLNWPRVSMGFKVACAVPLLIGIKTLRKLRSEQILDAKRRIKVSRGEVRSTLLKAVLFYPFPGLWTSLFRAERPRGHLKRAESWPMK